METTSRPDSTVQDQAGGPSDEGTSDMGLGLGIEGQAIGIQDAFTYSNDELAVLAESFFQQRNGNIVGNVDEWWNTGNL